MRHIRAILGSHHRAITQATIPVSTVSNLNPNTLGRDPQAASGGGEEGEYRVEGRVEFA